MESYKGDMHSSIKKVKYNTYVTTTIVVIVVL